MRNSKIKLLTGAACLALVGTASAAWVYAGSATASANIGVKIASYASAGTITLSDTSDIKIVLDKDSVYYLDGKNEVTATYAPPTNLSVPTGKKITYAYTCYVQGGNQETVGLHDLITFQDTTNVKEEYYMNTWTSGQAFTLPALKWVDGKCPSTFEGYKALLGNSTEANESEDTGELDAPESWYMKLEVVAAVIDEA